MRWSRTFIPTLRDNPAEAEFPSHRLLVRGGFLRQLAAGLFACLPLGLRTMHKIGSIIREELVGVGAQEFHLPALHPAELQEETRCPEDMRENGFRLRDHAGRDLYLGEAYRNIITEIVRKEIRSYRNLPQIWYLFQDKFCDEARPKTGLMRLRQFSVSHSYSLDTDLEGLDRSYQMHHDAYCRIFARCGLKFVAAEAWPAATGDDRLQEFMVRTEAGEDFVASCQCGYAAKLEKATSRLEDIENPHVAGGPQLVHTPDRKTIAEITEFLKVSPAHQIKSLVYMIDGRLYLFLVRGDHQLSEAKMMAAVKGVQVNAANTDEIRTAFGADAGSLGPVGVESMPIYADLGLRGRTNLTCGANRNDYHLQGVTPDVHFKPVWTDLRTVGPGEACVLCGKPLEIYRAAEIGCISRLGSKYSDRTGTVVLAADGRQTPILMGSYGIGLERIMCSAVELHHDEDGIIWPPEIAPFSVIITPANYRDETRTASDRIYAELTQAGLDALLDDRSERPGVKFKDADLIGIPYRVVLGAANLKQGKAELFERATKQTQLLDLDSVVPTLTKLLIHL